jgi:hypothetical protein
MPTESSTIVQHTLDKEQKKFLKYQAFKGWESVGHQSHLHVPPGAP